MPRSDLFDDPPLFDLMVAYDAATQAHLRAFLNSHPALTLAAFHHHKDETGKAPTLEELFNHVKADIKAANLKRMC